jgi:hypothetical protein
MILGLQPHECLQYICCMIYRAQSYIGAIFQCTVVKQTKFTIKFLDLVYAEARYDGCVTPR